ERDGTHAFEDYVANGSARHAFAFVLGAVRSALVRTVGTGRRRRTRGRRRRQRSGRIEGDPMSEYQYYEFLALDRRLTEKEMKELRALSSRAADGGRQLRPSVPVRVSSMIHLLRTMA